MLGYLIQYIHQQGELCKGYGTIQVNLDARETAQTVNDWFVVVANNIAVTLEQKVN